MGLFLSRLWDWWWRNDPPHQNWVEVIEDGEVVARYIEWEVQTPEKIYKNKLIQTQKQV